MTPAFDLFNINDPNMKITVPSGTILLAYRGSIAHGMYVPNTDPDSIDDVDLMGAVIGTPQHYFGLREWGSRGTKEIKEGRYDCVFYEIRKLVSLLLQGNPNVLSLLWLRDYLHLSPWGKSLIEARWLFVGKHVYNAFAGYAHAQMEKMELRDPSELRMYLALTAEAMHRGIHPNHKGVTIPYPEDYDHLSGEARVANTTHDSKLLQMLAAYHKKGENIGYLGDKRKRLVLQHGYDSKNAAHLIRLLRMCREFLLSGQLTVYRPDAAELLDIKRGKWPLAQVKQHAAELFEACRNARDASPLPAFPDHAKVEDMLVNLIRDYLFASGEGYKNV